MAGNTVSRKELEAYLLSLSDQDLKDVLVRLVRKSPEAGEVLKGIVKK